MPPNLTTILSDAALTRDLALSLLRWSPQSAETTRPGTNSTGVAHTQLSPPAFIQHPLPLLLLALDCLGYLKSTNDAVQTSSDIGLGIQTHNTDPSLLVLQRYIEFLYAPPHAVLPVSPDLVPSLHQPDPRRTAEESLHALEQYNVPQSRDFGSEEVSIPTLLDASLRHSRTVGFSSFHPTIAQSLVEVALRLHNSTASEQEHDASVRDAVSTIIKHHLGEKETLQTQLSASTPTEFQIRPTSSLSDIAHALLLFTIPHVSDAGSSSSLSHQAAVVAASTKDSQYRTSFASSRSSSSGERLAKNQADPATEDDPLIPCDTAPPFLSATNTSENSLHHSEDGSFLPPLNSFARLKPAPSRMSTNTTTTITTSTTSSSACEDEDDPMIPLSARSSSSYASHHGLLPHHSHSHSHSARGVASGALHSASLDVPRSPAPFSTSLVPTSSDKASQPSALPPTTNELSPDERRDLVRRSRKIQKMLGATLGEDAAEKTLLQSRGRSKLRIESPPLDESGDAPQPPTREPLRHQRSMSYPPPSPTTSVARRVSGKANLYHTAYGSTSVEELGASPVFNDAASDLRSPSSAFTSTSPETSFSPATPYDFESMDHWGQSEIYGYRDPVKEARRRRVRKLHAMLGEQVPLNVILEYERTAAGAPSSEVPPVPQPSRKHARSSSRIGQAFARLRGKKTGSAQESFSSGTSDDEEWVFPQDSTPDCFPKDAPFNARDKKLMALFGAVPPAILRTSAHPQSERQTSDRLSILEDSPASSPELNISMSKRQSTVSAKSSRASLRRQSLAALLYMAEREPATLAMKLQQLYSEPLSPLEAPREEDEDAEQSGDESESGFADLSGRSDVDVEMSQDIESERSAPNEKTNRSGHHHASKSTGSSFSTIKRPSSSGRPSAEHYRNFQKAAKLSKVLGSEVLTRVLEDIEADMLEDPEAGHADRRALRKLQETLT